MKVMIMLFAALFVGLTGSLTAQNKPNMFATQASCTAAVVSGNFGSYVPHNFGLKNKSPKPGTKVDSVQTERPGCFYMLTFQGWQWVSEETGTKMITCNGVICGLAACWNPVKEFTFPESPVAPSSEAPRIVTPTSSRLDVYHHFDTLQTKVSGQLNLAWLESANNSSKPTPAKKGGFWCFRGVGQFAACAAVVGGVVVGVSKLTHHDDKKTSSGPPSVTTDSAKVGPGVTTGGSGKCQATSYPNNCPSGSVVSGFDRPQMRLMLQPRQVGIGGSIGFRM